MLARRPVLGGCALALAGILYGASTEPLAWVLSTGVDAEAFLSLRFAFAFAALALLLFCRRPVTDPVALLKAGVGCGLALASSYLCLVHGLPATGSTTAGVLVSGFGIWAAGIDALVRRRRPSRSAVTALVVAGSGLLLLYAGPAMSGGPIGMDATGWLLTAALGVGVSGGAYLLQAIGQSVVPAATAGLLLVTEPLSAVLVGWAAGDRPGLVSVAGLGLIVLALLFALRTPPGETAARPLSCPAASTSSPRR